MHLPVNAIVRLPHSRSRDSQGQETFLAPSAKKQTHNYDAECSTLYINIKAKYIYIYIYNKKTSHLNTNSKLELKY